MEAELYKAMKNSILDGEEELAAMLAASGYWRKSEFGFRARQRCHF